MNILRRLWTRLAEDDLARREANPPVPREMYCTKHVLQSVAGGPERLVWCYGYHRTQGNACDGPEHHRRGLAHLIGDLL